MLGSLLVSSILLTSNSVSTDLDNLHFCLCFHNPLLVIYFIPQLSQINSQATFATFATFLAIFGFLSTLDRCLLVIKCFV